MLHALYIGGLRARLLGGDCPAYQTANPVNVDAAFDKLQKEVPRKDAEEFLQKLVERWARKQEKDGGHPPAKIVATARKLAKTHKMEHVLEAMAGK